MMPALHGSKLWRQSFPRKGKVARPQAATEGVLYEASEPHLGPVDRPSPLQGAGQDAPIRHVDPSPEPRSALAIGVGFRKACAQKTLIGLVRQALVRATSDHPWLAGCPAVLATIAEKDRPVLRAAGAELGLEVVILSRQALDGTDDRITMASETVKACLGIPSVAEAAALAAAGPGARLIVPRMAVADATCAIAASTEGVLT